MKNDFFINRRSNIDKLTYVTEFLKIYFFSINEMFTVELHNLRQHEFKENN